MKRIPYRGYAIDFDAQSYPYIYSTEPNTDQSRIDLPMWYGIREIKDKIDLLVERSEASA
ncbi:MAG: hypothetical protein WC047_00205 [Kiritimatiellales bacterium]